jgi:hypothetical protein
VHLVHEAGLPPDWCQTFLPETNELAEAFATDLRIAFLSFISSSHVGWYLRSKLPPGTRCALDHGGAAPAIIDRGPSARSSPGSNSTASAGSSISSRSMYIKALKMSDAGNPAVKERAAARPTVKRHLVAIRMLFDWLIVGQILAINPAHAVRGPKHVVKRGKTPVLQVSEQLVRNILGLAQSGNGAIEVPRVPQDDCGDEEVQAQSAVLLVLGRGLERVMSWSLPAHGSGGPLADRGTRRRQAAAPAGWRGHVVILYREPRD